MGRGTFQGIRAPLARIRISPKFVLWHLLHCATLLVKIDCFCCISFVVWRLFGNIRLVWRQAFMKGLKKRSAQSPIGKKRIWLEETVFWAPLWFFAVIGGNYVWKHNFSLRIICLTCELYVHFTTRNMSPIDVMWVHCITWEDRHVPNWRNVSILYHVRRPTCPQLA